MLQRFDVKLVLAAISGGLVSLVVYTPELGILDTEELAWNPVPSLYNYGLSGTLFAVSILWPYLQSDTRFLPRGLALIAASIASFWSAVMVFDSGDFLEWLPGCCSDISLFIASSIVGAAIVFLAAKYLVPFNWSSRYLLFGVLAAIAGGWAFDALVNTPVVYDCASFIAWHCIVCAALHFGTRRAGERGYP
jgi:hypothetical protein